MEAGFRIIPGKEQAFFERQGATVPVAMEQPGFVSVYGGPILDSTWLYFGVRFDRADAMDAWQHHAHHREVQRLAYEKWWTAVYIRKWRRLAADEPETDRYMLELRLRTPSPLAEDPLRSLRTILETLRHAGAARFETLTGEHEPQPWQFVGPLEIAPSDGTVLYSLITHWTSRYDADRWLRSAACDALRRLGEVESELFIAMPESGHRERLRADRLQRQWTRGDSAG
jgi:hypothetical protein